MLGAQPGDEVGLASGQIGRWARWNSGLKPGDLYLERQAVDTTTPAGRALFQMLGVFAEFERSIIQERVKAGMERARKHGTKSGKPIGQPPLAQAKVEAIRAELARGTGVIKTARLCGTGVSAVCGATIRVRGERQSR
jgi:DNA invertase Pin-like site-specific DNA recombinase